jgi:hypothetical protein
MLAKVPTVGTQIQIVKHFALRVRFETSGRIFSVVGLAYHHNKNPNVAGIYTSRDESY